MCYDARPNRRTDRPGALKIVPFCSEFGIHYGLIRMQSRDQLGAISLKDRKRIHGA